MRCVSCSKNVKKGKSNSFSGRCPSCGHSFTVTDPKSEGVSDANIKAAIVRASKNGTHRYLPEHAAYELERFIMRRRRPVKWFWLGAVLSLSATLWIVAKFISSGSEAVVFAVFVGIGITGYFINQATRRNRSPRDIPRLVERFSRGNPDPCLVPESSAVIRAVLESSPSPAVTPNRVVVCEKRRHADFLLANQIHLKNACAVVAADGYPQEIFPDAVARAKQAAAPEVFVLHDYSPRGLQLVDDVKSKAQWFGDHPGATIEDLGLGEAHLPLVRRMSRPVTHGGSTREASGLPPGHGVELMALRPVAVVALALGTLVVPPDLGARE